MKFQYVHNNVNVNNLEESMAFYKEALGMTATRRKEASDGSYTIVWIANEHSAQEIELTWVRDQKEAYDLGDNEIHMGFLVDDYEGAFKKHTDMGVVCFENKEIGIYFIADPTGYWVEIIPTRR